MKARQDIQRKKSRHSGLNLVAVIFFILAAVFYFAHEKKPFLRAQPADNMALVSTVHDGDTVSILMQGRREKVRLIGIDAPEIGQMPWGEDAKKSLESIVEHSSRRVSVEYDVEKTDQYGRTLAYLWTADGIFINLLMLERGHAMLYTVPPNTKYVERFRHAQAQAREKGIGMWNEQGLKEKPRDYRKENPRL